jgi:hypothetical protein
VEDIVDIPYRLSEGQVIGLRAYAVRDPTGAMVLIVQLVAGSRRADVLP